MIYAKLSIRCEIPENEAARCKSSKCFQVFCWLETPYYRTGDKLVRCLPDLTGCDTTSKIFTKHAAMNPIHSNLTLIQNFKSLTTQS